MKLQRNLIDEVLNDQEIESLSAFYNNKVMREAVKKVLLFGIYNNGTLKKGKRADPMLNFALGLVANAEELRLDNEKIGAQLRSAWEGIQLVEIGFNGIALYAKEEPEKTTQANPAR